MILLWLLVQRKNTQNIEVNNELLTGLNLLQKSLQIELLSTRRETGFLTLLTKTEYIKESK